MSTALKDGRQGAALRRWTPQEWLDHGRELHQAKWRIEAALWAAFPSKGLSVKIADHLIWTASVIEMALVAMEGVIFEHFGSDWSKAPKEMQRFPQQWFERPEMPKRDCGLKRIPLTSAERLAVLADLDAALELLTRCRTRFAGSCAGARRKRHLVRIDQAIRRVGTAQLRIKAFTP